MKKTFAKKTLHRDYVFRFRINNCNFTCKLIAIDKGFDNLLDLPYITYSCMVCSPSFYSFVLPRLLTFSYDLNYRTFRRIVQDEVVSYVSQTLFDK